MRLEENMSCHNQQGVKSLAEILNWAVIKLTDNYDVPPRIIWIDATPIGTLGNFSASVGKAKAKKTFNVAAIVAAAISGKQVLKYSVSLPEGRNKVLYIDTEQSRYHCHRLLKTIHKMAGLATDIDDNCIEFLCLREFTPSIRRDVIEYALYQNDNIGLVVIDGIRDLLVDINNAAESIEVINKLMEWSASKDVHIHCVLHLNKGDNNTRGHIGTEMNNKAETVLCVTKDSNDPSTSTVEAMHTREKDFKPFSFKINKDGMPELVEKIQVETSTRNMNSHDFTYKDLTIDDHRDAMRIIFNNGPVTCSYTKMLEMLRRAYGIIGFKRGLSIMVKILMMLKDMGLVIHTNKEYTYVEQPP